MCRRACSRAEQEVDGRLKSREHLLKGNMTPSAEAQALQHMHSDLEFMKRELSVIKHSLSEEGKLTGYAKKTLAEARATPIPKYVDYRALIDITDGERGEKIIPVRMFDKRGRIYKRA
jgi:hypothetical protein